jgi:hypothetical protein
MVQIKEISIYYTNWSLKVCLYLGAFKKRSFKCWKSLFCNQELLEDTSIPSGAYQIADDQPLSTNELILY